MQNNRKCTPTLHFQVYNYMRPEPGAVKDEPVGTNANPDRTPTLTLTLPFTPTPTGSISIPFIRSSLTRSGTSTSSQPS